MAFPECSLTHRNPSGRVFQPRPANDFDVAHDTAPRGVGVTGLPGPERRPEPVVKEPTSEERRAWRVMLGSLARWLEGGVQVSAEAGKASGARGTSSAGRVEVRWRVSRANYAAWHGLKAQARRWLPSGMSMSGSAQRFWAKRSPMQKPRDGPSSTAMGEALSARRRGRMFGRRTSKTMACVQLAEASASNIGSNRSGPFARKLCVQSSSVTTQSGFLCSRRVRSTKGDSFSHSAPTAAT
jgi:hypothetical protein